MPGRVINRNGNMIDRYPDTYDFTIVRCPLRRYFCLDHMATIPEEELDAHVQTHKIHLPHDSCNYCKTEMTGEDHLQSSDHIRVLSKRGLLICLDCASVVTSREHEHRTYSHGQLMGLLHYAAPIPMTTPVQTDEVQEQETRKIERVMALCTLGSRGKRFTPDHKHVKTCVFCDYHLEILTGFRDGDTIPGVTKVKEAYSRCVICACARFRAGEKDAASNSRREDDCVLICDIQLMSAMVLSQEQECVEGLPELCAFGSAEELIHRIGEMAFNRMYRATEDGFVRKDCEWLSNSELQPGQAAKGTRIRNKKYVPHRPPPPPPEYRRPAKAENAGVPASAAGPVSTQGNIQPAPPVTPNLLVEFSGRNVVNSVPEQFKCQVFRVANPEPESDQGEDIADGYRYGRQN